MKKRVKGLAALLLAMAIAIISPMTTFAETVQVDVYTSGTFQGGDRAYFKGSGSLKQVIYKCEGKVPADPSDQDHNDPNGNIPQGIISNVRNAYTVKNVSDLFTADEKQYYIPTEWSYNLYGCGSDDYVSYYELILTATFTPVPYTITLDPAGGTLEEWTTKEYNVTTETFQLPIPTRKGFKFTGWTIEGSTEPVTEIVQGTYGNKTYTANWEKKSNKKQSSSDEEEETESVLTSEGAATASATPAAAVEPSVPVRVGTTEIPVDPSLLDEVPKTGQQDASDAFLILGSILTMAGIAVFLVKKRERTE